jgi:hypothetical protein
MVCARLGLLLDPDEQLPNLEEAARKLRALVPGIDADRFAEAFPAVLDVADFEAALEVRAVVVDMFCFWMIPPLAYPFALCAPAYCLPT